MIKNVFCNTTDSVKSARKSMPADSGVAYCGIACFDLFIIFTSIGLRMF